MQLKKKWFESWFDTPYYHTLYKHRDYNEAANFIDKIITYLNPKTNAICWDLCCGKGRHSIYLHSKKLTVIGTDLSTQSILEANKSAQQNLDFFTHDMRKLYCTNNFDYVFNLFTSFGYFESQNDDLNVFKSVQKSLNPNGIFVFDFLNATYIKNIMVPYEEKIIDGVKFCLSKKIEENTIIKTINFTDNNIQHNYQERVKLFDKSYFEQLAKQANLKIINTFGNYNLDNFEQETSPRLILILQKQAL